MSGSEISSLFKTPRSCAPVRAPIRALVTPGASRTHAKATSSGENPKPSAATATASTIFIDRASRYGSMCLAKCGAAPRESLGIPFRYLPVNTPRANGAHAKKPKPHSREASISSYSADLFKSEYSL